MNKIVLNGISDKNFSIINFYKKRVQRIVPALAFLIGILIVICYFIYFPGELHVMIKNSLGSLLFYSNILYNNVNYFDSSSETNILLHTWSLSVEWQFYLLLPIVLVLLNKFFAFDKTKYLILFSVSTFVLFIISAYFTKWHLSAGFYYLPFRAWEMMLGGTAFLYEGQFKIHLKKQISIFCYILLVLCLVFLSNDMVWPGIYTLLPVSLTFILLIANINDFAVLKAKPLQFLGKISYSLYLWHWPVYVIARHFGVEASIASDVFLILLSILLAVFSFVYIENYKFVKTSYILLLNSLLMIICIIFTFNDLNKNAFSGRILSIAEYQKNNKKLIATQFSESCCFLTETTEEKSFNKVKCLTFKKNRKNILLFGDSHAGQFSQSFKDRFDMNKVNLLQTTVGGCLPILHRKGSNLCNKLYDDIFYKFIPKNAKRLDGIILAGFWADTQYDVNSIVPSLQETIKYLNNLGIPVIILGQHETYTYSYPSLAAREIKDKVNLSTNFISEKSIIVNTLMVKGLGDSYINIYDVNKNLKLSPNDIPYMVDKDHYSKYGADIVTNYLLHNSIFEKFLYN
jgi:peptidoglycan/LPS O-acetylase OafA/YrhL